MSKETAFDVKIWVNSGGRSLVKKLRVPFPLTAGLRLVVGMYEEVFVDVVCEDVTYVPKTKSFVVYVTTEDESSGSKAIQDDVDFWVGLGFVEKSDVTARPGLRLVHSSQNPTSRPPTH